MGVFLNLFILLSRTSQYNYCFENKGLGPDTKSLNAGAQNKNGKQAVAAGGGAGGPANQEDADLEARLDALRRQ